MSEASMPRCDRTGLLLLLLVLGSLLGWPLTDASAQEVAMAGRGPRFLRSAPSGNARVEVSTSSMPLRKLVSLDFDRPTVGRLLDAIERQASIKFVYNLARLPANRVVDLQASKITVAAALTAILLDTGLDVLLNARNHLVLVERDGNTARYSGTIVGTITDGTTGNALAGVDVLLDGTRWRTTSDTNGHYVLAEVDTGTYTMTVRRLGYTKRTRKVTVRGVSEDTVNVALSAAAMSLNELVTTATGPQRRRDLGNAITTIRADSVLQTAPIRSLTDLLENRVPGLSVQRTSGAPGDPARLRLRGLGSPTLSNDPVFIVDGVRIYAAQSGARSGNLTDLASATEQTPAPSPIDQIDPNIIDKIEVFKGPSAATLYGADAANGVVVITTKRGKAGPTRWTANLSHGRTTTPGRYPEAYFRWGHTFLEGLSQFCTIMDSQCVADSLVRYQAMNDPAMTMLGDGRSTDLSLTASGGTQALTYSITGSYGTELGLLRLPAFEAERFRARFSREAPDWMQRPWRYDTWSVGTNVTARLSATADVTLSARVNRSEQQRSSLERQAARLSGMYVDKVNGKYYIPDPLGYTLNQTPTVLSDFYRRITASTLGFNTSLAASWRPRPWFDGSAQAGLDVGPRDDESFLPGGIVSAADGGTVIRGTGRAIVSTFNVQGQLRKPVGWGFIFRTNVGANLVTATTSDVATTAIGLVPGTSALAGANRFHATDLHAATSVFGWYIEPTLTGQRLSFSTGIRLDGGSNSGTRLSSSTGGGSFLKNLLALPKLNGSWVISEEPWFPFTSLFSSLRLRGAYGQSQQQPQLSSRLRLYSPSVNHLGELLTLTTLGNSELRPERYVEFEGGFDADVFDNRLSIELTGYNKTTVDALMSVSLPPSVNGRGSVTQNIGNIRNRGFDLTLTVTPVRTSALTWSATVVHNQNNNVLVELGRGVVENRRTGLVAGYPVGGRWAAPIIGYADENGDGALQRREIQVSDSLVFMGRILPNRQHALFTNVALFGGALGLSAGFAYETGATQIDETASTNFVLAGPLFDPSTPLSEQAAVVASIGERGANGVHLGEATDYGVTQHVSTFRFHSLSVNYRAPQRVARLIGAEQLSVALQGSNLGLHSSYRGKDPDVSAWSPGDVIRDTGQLPLPRTWQLRFSVNY